jgi:hypothetical protein
LGNANLEEFLLDIGPRPGTPLSLPAILGSRPPRVSHSLDNLTILSVDAMESLLPSGPLALRSEDSLLSALLGLDTEYAPLLRHVRFADVPTESVVAFASNFHDKDYSELLWAALIGHVSTALTARQVFANAIDSQILTCLPKIFENVGIHSCRLLWRGSRDGFGNVMFSSRCHGHQNILVIILDTNGNVFGGFKPISLKTPEDCTKPQNADSFIFTINNPGHLPARVFSLKKSIKIRRFQPKSPESLFVFGFGDLVVSADCNLNMNSSSECFGRTYENDSGRAGNSLLTGSTHFKVEEIEVFEVGL